MKVGDRIKVTAKITVYHHPAHKGQAFNIQGMEGQVVEIMLDWQGRPISPNYPYKVDFGDRFFAHLADHEMELTQPLAE